MYPTNPARMGSSQVCESAVAVTHFTREIATVVHPVASHARWDHVDCKVGSSSVTRWWLVGVGVGAVSRGGGDSMTRWCPGLYLSFLVVVVVEQRIRMGRHWW